MIPAQPRYRRRWPRTARKALYLDTDALSADTDGDGVPDGEEEQNGTDPLDPEDGGGTGNSQDSGSGQAEHQGSHR